MKKIMLSTLVVIACLFIFSGCNQAEYSTELSEEDKYLVELSKKAESFEEIFFILEKNDSEIMQMELSKVDNPIVQQALLNYENLSANALINICQNPHEDLNLKHDAIKSYFISAISNAELSPEEEMSIAQIKEYAMQIGLLSREEISADTLIYILNANNNEFNWVINLENSEVKQHIYNHVLRVSLTSKQKKQLEKMNISYVDYALEAR